MFEFFVKLTTDPDIYLYPLLGVAMIALCAALLGVNLVLKRYSMIGDGLSHVGYGAMAIAALVTADAPLMVAIPLVMLAAYFLLRITESGNTSGDSAIAMISVGSLAVGRVIVSLSGNDNMDIDSYLFGNPAGIGMADLIPCAVLTVVIVAVFLLLNHRIFSVTFDESFAHATGIRTKMYNMLVALLTAVTVVLGMKLIGALLISSLMVFPVLTSMRVFRRYQPVLRCAAGLSVFCVVLGFWVSDAAGTPVSSSVVCMHILVFLLFHVVGKAISSLGKPSSSI